MTIIDTRPDCERDPEQPSLCDCARLWGLRYLNDGERLPSHVGTATMQVSCATWLQDSSGGRRLPPVPTVVPLSDGRVTEPVLPSQWPVPIQDSHYRVMLVLRQWVEEEPDEQLGRLFAEVDAWGQVLQAVRAAGRLEDAPLRSLLLANGLPGTPGTVQYLRSRMQNPIEPAVPGPTRGILVTSFVLESPNPGAHDEVISTITCSTPWTTDALRRRASRTVAEHARWWGSLPQSSLPDLDLRKLNRRPPDELTEDLLLFRRGELTREELDTRALQRARELLGDQWDPGKKRRMLQRVAQRVREAERGDLR